MVRGLVGAQYVHLLPTISCAAVKINSAPIIVRITGGWGTPPNTAIVMPSSDIAVE
ncbi:hypothetical protein JCM19238_4486 [Vibrio ponticus]|nr:hypothetical protein JCM19238_4486 [Vibrio ponticus]